jgi:nicotinate-nucleotide adenylyltransferase
MRTRLGRATELFFIVGEDALEDLPYWHKPQEILSMATLAVAPRLDTPAPVPPEEVTTGGLELGEYERIRMPFVGISSTDLRERVSRGLSLRYFTTEAVDAYIRENGLYL